MKDVVKFETKVIIDIPIIRCDECKKTLSSPFVEAEKIFDLKEFNLTKLFSGEYLYQKEFCQKCYADFLKKNYDTLKVGNEEIFKKLGA